MTKPAEAAGYAAALLVPHVYDVVIVGGGAGGVAVAASLLTRRPTLSIALIEPEVRHFYQPGWTLVGGGVFAQDRTVRPMDAVIPRGVRWIKGAAARFDPVDRRVILRDGRAVQYRGLVLSPGISLDWAAIAGLTATLGKNGVTSNYRFDLAPYTWQLVQALAKGEGRGRAIFTQPPMPIKCAGAPQKALYLACDAWRRAGRQDAMGVAFHTATPSLFGVADYVPALTRAMQGYGVDVRLGSKLVAVDGPERTAVFETVDAAGSLVQHTVPFDMLHVCPPQKPPLFIKESPFADPAGYVAVDPHSLQHPVYPTVFALGDGCSTPNAKTAAAARKQAPVVATNLLAVLDGRPLKVGYDGYGSCPLTVARGKIVLAEFAYQGVVKPTFPVWLLDGRQPTRAAWFLKAWILPHLYWHGMLRGREWLATPQNLVK